MGRVRNHITYIKSADVVAQESPVSTKKVTAEKRVEDPKNAEEVLKKHTKGVNEAKDKESK